MSALARALEDRELGVQCNAAEALGKLGPAAKAAIPALTEAAKYDPSGYFRDAAREALEKIRAPE